MISSAPKLNACIEFVTNPNMTGSPIPELASLITSALGPVGLMVEGTVFSFETSLAGASVSAGGAGSCADASEKAAGSSAAIEAAGLSPNGGLAALAQGC